MEKKRHLILALCALLMLPMALTGCSHDDDDLYVVCPGTPALRAIVVEEGAQLYDITEEDVVLTIENIVACNPKTGLFKLKGVSRIVEKSYPLPTQYCIRFFAANHMLFEARLNNTLSSYMPSGLIFYSYSDPSHPTDDISWFKLTSVVIKDGDTTIGAPTKDEQKGIADLYSLLGALQLLDENLTVSMVE